MKKLSIKLVAILFLLGPIFGQAQITEDDIIKTAKKSLHINQTSIVDLSLHENVTTNDVISHLLNTSKDKKLKESIDKYKSMLEPYYKEVYSLEYTDESGSTARAYVLLSEDDEILINKNFEQQYSVAHTKVVTHLLDQLKDID